MKPRHQPGTNAILGMPKGWDVKAMGPCEGLPIIYRDNVCYSYWSVTLAERLRILFGRPVRLAVTTTAHPPVMLDTEVL